MAEKEGKKRKRQSGNGVDRPSKKVAVEGANGGNISVIFSEEEGLPPVLVASPGLTAPSIPFQPYAKARSSKNVSKPPTPKTHDLLLQSSKHPRVDYTAAPSGLDQYLSHYIAVFDPATNSLQITPAHHVSLRSAPRKTAVLDDEYEKQRRATHAAQRETLGQEFGTKKAKKAIASRTDNAITKDAKGKGKKDDVQDAILESMADTTDTAPKKEQIASDLLASKPIPKPNLAAVNVEDVYPLNTLIPPSDFRLLPIKDWQDTHASGQGVQVVYRYTGLRTGPLLNSDQIVKLKALRYVQLLLEFHDALQSAGRSGKKVPKKEILDKRLAAWPEQLVDSVRRRFSNERQELPKWEMDNLYTHICAISLFVDDWRTNTQHLKDDLKLENKVVGQYFSELGAKVSAPTEKDREVHGLNKAQASVVKMARLKLPLEFPKPRVGRRT